MLCGSANYIQQNNTQQFSNEIHTHCDTEIQRIDEPLNLSFKPNSLRENTYIIEDKQEQQIYRDSHGKNSLGQESLSNISRSTKNKRKKMSDMEPSNVNIDKSQQVFTELNKT